MSAPATIAFAGVNVMVVEVGTSISDERTGRTEIVDDGTFVAKGNVIFCTQTVFDRLKAQIPGGDH